MEIKILNVNQNKKVFYEVEYYDTFESISKLFSIPVDYIKQNNPGSLYEGKVLYLPEINFKSYVVKPFDTLLKISERFDISTENLKLKNALNSDYVFVGQKLYI